jgi:hypothetical protein
MPKEQMLRAGANSLTSWLHSKRLFTKRDQRLHNSIDLWTLSIPPVEVGTGVRVGVTPRKIASLSSLADSFEQFSTDKINAAAPETNGAAMDVPLLR